VIDRGGQPDLARLERSLLDRRGRRLGREIRFLCPAHDDTRPSARWSGAKAVWYCDVCQAGGGWRDLCGRLGIEGAAAAPPPARPPAAAAMPPRAAAGRGARSQRGPRGEVVATYRYTDGGGRLLYEVLRLQPKDFICRRPDGPTSAGGWVWDLQGVERVLYRLPEVLTAVARDEIVYLVEGEKDADALAALGFAATTHAGGAGRWRPEYARPLRGARVVVIGDNDEPGRRHADSVVACLRRHAAAVGRLELPGVPAKGDVSDWLAARRGEGLAEVLVRCRLLDLALSALASAPLALAGDGEAAARLAPATGMAAAVGAAPGGGSAGLVAVGGAATLATATSAAAVRDAGAGRRAGAERPARATAQGDAPAAAGAGIDQQIEPRPGAPTHREQPAVARDVAAAGAKAAGPDGEAAGAGPEAAGPDGGAAGARLARSGSAAAGAPERPAERPGAGPFRCLADVAPEPVSFLWEPYLPLGKLTLLEGDPGQGKSWLTAAIAAAGSRGRGLPGGDSFPPFRTLFLTAEDGIADTLRPRVEALGGDCAAVFTCDQDQPLSLAGAAGLAAFGAALAALAPRLVVIDPLVAFLGGATDIYRANEVRAVLAPLVKLAERWSCALLAIRHLNKAKLGRTIYAGQGSIDFTAAARSVLLAGSAAEDAGAHALVHLKSNLAPQGPTLGYRLLPAFAWGGTSRLTAGDLLASAAPADEANAEDDARTFLRTTLGGPEPLPARLVLNAARDAGISQRTLKRAKRREGVRTTRRGFGAGSTWLWSLPEREGGRAAGDEGEGAEAAEEVHMQSWPPSLAGGPDRGSIEAAGAVVIGEGELGAGLGEELLAAGEAGSGEAGGRRDAGGGAYELEPVVEDPNDPNDPTTDPTNDSTHDDRNRGLLL
jgi:hypothetical protein